MKAALLDCYGEQATFAVRDIAAPTIRAGHVVVRIAASSVNTVDTMIRSMGTDLGPIAPNLPAVLGMDFAGTVIAVGDDVAEFSVGDEVYGCAGGLGELQGALAEEMCVDKQLLALKPKSLSMRQAAALPLVAITAYEGLQRSGVTSGQTVLVHGGSGGVGHVAVQLARYMGAEVFSTGGGSTQLEMIRSLGATPINYRTEAVSDYVAEHTGGAGFDVVYDSVGGVNMLNSFEAAKLNAQVVTTVAMVELDLTPAHFKGLSLHVVFMLIPMLHGQNRQNHGDILQKITDIVDAGHLTPVVDEKEFSLESVADAYARLTSGDALGKVVVTL